MTSKFMKDKNIEIGALLEDFNSKFDLVVEQTSQIPEIKNKVDGMIDDMEIIKTDLEFIKNFNNFYLKIWNFRYERDFSDSF